MNNDFNFLLHFLAFDVPNQDRDNQLSSLFVGFAGGAASRAAKEILLHPIDTIRYDCMYIFDFFSHCVVDKDQEYKRTINLPPTNIYP